MNIQENIYRIKEVMGLNESKIPSQIIRRANEETLEKYIAMAEEEYPTLCDDFEDEYEYVDNVIDSAIDKFLQEIDISIIDNDNFIYTSNYLRDQCRDIFGSHLLDVYKDTCSSLNESTLPIEVKRRLNLSEEQIRNDLKKWIMRLSKDYNKDSALSRSFKQLTQELLEMSRITDTEMYNERIFDTLNKYLSDKYKDEMGRFYDEIFGDNDYESYCFIKHSERHGGLQSRGFSECIIGWNDFLSRYGFWLPHLDWNEIKKKLNDSPPKTKILLANPLEGHVYEYYFSVLKRG